MKDIDADAFRDFITGAIEESVTVAIRKIVEETIRELNIGALSNVVTEVIKALGTKTIKGLCFDAVNDLDTDAIRGLVTDAAKDLDADAVRNLVTDAVKTLSAAAVRDLVTDAIRSLDTGVIDNFVTVAIGDLDIDVIKNLDINEFKTLVINGIKENAGDDGNLVAAARKNDTDAKNKLVKILSSLANFYAYRVCKSEPGRYDKNSVSSDFQSGFYILVIDHYDIDRKTKISTFIRSRKPTKNFFKFDNLLWRQIIRDKNKTMSVKATSLDANDKNYNLKDTHTYNENDAYQFYQDLKEYSKAYPILGKAISVLEELASLNNSQNKDFKRIPYYIQTFYSLLLQLDDSKNEASNSEPLPEEDVDENAMIIESSNNPVYDTWLLCMHYYNSNEY